MSSPRFTPILGFVLCLLMLPSLHAQEQSSPFTYRRDTGSKHAKIFLVAGSAEAANFAQEVLDQKTLFLKAGFSEEEIACYYVPPYQEYIDADAEQYGRLAGALADCYLASAKRLHEDLKRAAKGKPDFLYLYFSTHGQEPFNRKVGQRSLDANRRYRFGRLAAYPTLRQFHLSMDALPDGPANFWEILGALRSGVDPEDLYLTAPTLTRWLNKYFKNTPKFVVLQACFSGGFLENPESSKKEATLKSLRAVTVLTAARQDRESFGCQEGVTRTVFGEAYLDAWSAGNPNPLQRDWQALYSQVQKKVKDVENQQGVSPPSLPQFFSNQDPAQP